jgi:hypothetical protein
MAEVYADNDLLALWTRLGVLAVERYASQDSDILRVHRNEISALAGGKRRDKAELTLNLLASKLELSCNKVGSYFEIAFRNLSEKQGFGPTNEQELCTPNTKTNTNTKEVAAQEESDPPSGVKFGKIKPLLSSDFVLKLQALRPGGVEYTPEEIQAWYLKVLPSMKLRRVKNTKRAAGNWFQRVTRQEIQSAVQWVEMQALDEVRSAPAQKREMDDPAFFAEMMLNKSKKGNASNE